MPDTGLSALCYYLNSQAHPVRHVLLLSQMRKLRNRKMEVLAQDHRGMQPWGQDYDMNIQNPKAKKSTWGHPVPFQMLPTYDLCTGYANTLKIYHGPACLYLCTGCLFARQPFSSTGRFVLIPHFPCYDVFPDSLDRNNHSSPFC